MCRAPLGPRAQLFQSTGSHPCLWTMWAGLEAPARDTGSRAVTRFRLTSKVYKLIDTGCLLLRTSDLCEFNSFWLKRAFAAAPSFVRIAGATSCVQVTCASVTWGANGLPPFAFGRAAALARALGYAARDACSLSNPRREKDALRALLKRRRFLLRTGLRRPSSPPSHSQRKASTEWEH